MKSKSSTPFTTSLPNDAAEAVLRIAADEGVSAREVIRRAVLEYLDSKGFTFAPYSPTWGERTDLHPVRFPVDPKIIENALKNGVPESVRRPSKHKKTQSNEN